MAYEITKIGNDFNAAQRLTVMITSADDLDDLPVDEMAVDSVAKTADYTVYAVLGIDKLWHRLA